MSDRPDNNTDALDGGWHAPPEKQLWVPVEKDDAPDTEWRVPALPADMNQHPDEDGGWHLPAPDDTSYHPDQEITVSESRTPAAKKPVVDRPEDLIDEILGKAKAPARPEDSGFSQSVPPEDYVLTDAVAGEDDSAGAVRPEDFGFFDETADTDEDATTILPPEDFAFSDDDPETVDADVQDALDTLDDDDDAFSVSELIALQSLEEGAHQDDATLDPSVLDPEDLSPAAQAALFNAANMAAEIIPSGDYTADEADTNAQMEGESAADYAARMAQQFASGDFDAAAGDTVDPMGAAAGDEDAANYAARMAQQFASGDFGDDAGQTGASDVYGTQPMDTEQQELARQFIQTKQQVDYLRGLYNNGQIGYDEFQERLRQNSILDQNNNWWMLGVETDRWYRYDNMTGQWVEDDPPVPLDESAAAGSGYQDDVLAGSLPPLEGSQYGDAGMSPGDTPVPYPNQPVNDPDMTMVGPSASADYLDDAQTTMPNQQFGEGATMPSASTIATDSAYDEYSPMVESAVDYAQEPPSYDLDQTDDPARESQYEKARKNERNRALTIVVGLVVLMLACGLVTGIGTIFAAVSWYNGVVDPYEQEIIGLANYEPEFLTARIMDANGDLIVELNSREGGARERIRLGQMSPFLIHAVLSTENDTFYEDPGFSFPAMVRAFLQNLTTGEIESGASTITQQIARNLILQNAEVTADRKVTEVLVANRIAEQYTKNEILELYLNEIFFGNQSYGVEAASQFYFEKPAADLNMAESALLAGLIASPAANDPVTNPQEAIRAMRNVLRLMLDAGCFNFQHGEWVDDNQFCIDETTTVEFNGEEARLVRVNDDGTYGGLLALQLAQVETRQYLPRAAQVNYPHFVNFIQAQVDAQFGQGAMFQRGFTIYTTLIPRIQEDAQDALTRRVAQLGDRGVNTGAVMVTDPTTGAIRAMVGSPDFSDEEIDGQVDNTRTYQQPGSAIKPVVYTAALEGVNGNYLTPASILWDVPSNYNGYQPVNFRTGTYYGPTPLRQALQGSYNVSAVKAYEFIGSQKFQETAERLGIRFIEDTSFGLPSALGANDVRLIDMMKVYGTLANNGKYSDLFAIDRITEDAGGSQINVPLPERGPSQQVVTPQLAYLMQNILSDDPARASEFGSGSELTLVDQGVPPQNYVAAKTGTSNDGRDLWTMGFTNNAVVGVWLGTYDNSETIGLTGFTAAAPVWNRVLQTTITGRAPQQFQRPNGVVTNTVCAPTGTLAGDTCPNRRQEIYIQNQPPPGANQGFVQNILVDSWTGLRANEWCPDNQVQRVYSTINDPFAIEWINNTSQGRVYAQSIGLPLPLQIAPSDACFQGMQLPTVNLSQPQGGQTVSETVQILGQVSAGEFNRYELSYASANSPETFNPIVSSPQQQTNPNSLLGEWDSTGVPNGQYIIRLIAFSNAGGQVTRNAQVTVTNIPPTATPTPLPTQTPFVPAPTIDTGPAFTPLPFDTPIPFDDLGPTPTVDPFN